MPLHITYLKEEHRLDLSFSRNLDLSLARDIFVICKRVPPDLLNCIVDLSDVERLFDSEVALLRMLYNHLEDTGTTVVFLSDIPEVREQIPLIKRRDSHPVDDRYSSYYPKEVINPCRPTPRGSIWSAEQEG